MAGADHNLLIVSDLHISEGFRPSSGKWSRNEDFLSDDSFAAFLQYHEGRRGDGLPWRLIIAGDVFDFLQVTSHSAVNWRELGEKVDQLEHAPTRRIDDPGSRQSQAAQRLTEVIRSLEGETDDACRGLLACAMKLGDKLSALPDELTWALERLVLETWILAVKPKARLSKSDCKFGLGTSWPEATWKADRIAEGHPVFFSALAWFLARGNSVVMMKGNHDVELHWLAVQERLRELVADALANASLPVPPWPMDESEPDKTVAMLAREVQDRMDFCPWIYFEPGLLYIEHGNQYFLTDALKDFLNPILPQKDRLLRLPAGSLFVRYFFNKAEQTFPFIDNLRPRTRALAWAFQNRLLETIGLLVRCSCAFLRFLFVSVVRSMSDGMIDRRIDLGRKAIQDLADFDPAQALDSAKLSSEELIRIREVGGRKVRRAERALSLEGIIAADNSHHVGLVASARPPLTDEHLRRIEHLAKQERTKLLRRLGDIAVLLVPVGLAAVLIGIPLAIFGGPLVIFKIADVTGIRIDTNYPLWTAILSWGVFLVKQPLAWLIRRKTQGKDHLVEAAKQVWEILKEPLSSTQAPKVRYLVFGHTHDPNAIPLEDGDDAPWYVNTGSWLHSVDEIEAWDQLDRDFTFLRIIPLQKTSAPNLFRWNCETGRPEHIRRRITPEERKKSKDT